jgi:transcriptional regulator with XRE-family HTH domain
MTNPMQPNNLLANNLLANDNAFDRKVGAKMRMLRIQNGMTQKALAKKLEITFQQVQKYESGKNKMHAERLWRLSQIFGVPLSYWANEGEKGAQPAKANVLPPDDPAQPDRRAMHLVYYFLRIENRQTRNLLFSLAKLLAGQGSDSGGTPSSQ